MWTEARIKQYLDGTLTRVLYDGSISTICVDEDHIPKHTPRQIGRDRQPTQAKWTPAEDVILRELRNRNVPRPEIAKHLGRSDESIKHRIEYLKKKVARHAVR